MLFAFMGILFSILLIGTLTFAYADFFVSQDNAFDISGQGKPKLRLPESFTPHAIGGWFQDRWTGFQTSEKAVPGIFDKGAMVWVSYTILAILLFAVIWSYFGGAIARSAACEIAREGERIESAKAIKYAGQRFWSFFGAPLICVLGFLFFFFVTFSAGFLFRLLDFLHIGAPLAALLLPLAVLAGFVMALIAVGTLCGFPLFLPAVAVEGTDAFDAFSRGFSYIYSRPWHYLWYQVVTAGYGYVCCAFVILFTVLMVHLGLAAGAIGFDLIGDESKSFKKISDWSWSYVLSERHQRGAYEWSPGAVVRHPHPYGRVMHLASNIASPDFEANLPGSHENGRAAHSVAGVVLLAWLIIAMGLAYSFAVSYLISQQTMIYFILRKKVDEIDLKEIFFEEEADHLEPAPAPPPPAPAEPPAEAKPASEPPRTEEKKS
jgi:hypothetical protein